jgi:D-glycero-D-manno-heptose 1,7-bisphosphate phosphatase
VLLRLLSRSLAWLSTPALLRLGAFGGWVWYRIVPVRRREAREAIARVFPEKAAPEREAILLSNYRHLVTALLEAVAFLSYDDERLQGLVRFEGLSEAVTGAIARGRGSIVISAHIGSFELAMGAFGIASKVPVVIVARLPKAGFARAVLEAVRAKTGIEVLAPKGSLPRIVKRLKEEHAVLGFVIDQNMSRKRGVFVEFLGKWCATTPGFAVIARRSDAEIIPGWNERQPDGTHVGRFGPAVPRDLHPHPRVAILNDTWAMNQRCEEWVRRRPEQWFWVHRRWKTQPVPGDLVRTRRGLEVVRYAGTTYGRIAALLDRDGTVNREIGRAIHAPEELSLVPRAADAIRRLNGAAVPVFLVTNQAAVARGTIDEKKLGEIHARLADLLAAEGAHLDGIYYCPHHPTEGIGEYRRECNCRKPAPGMMRRAAVEHDLDLGRSLFVGDRAGDVTAARAAGMRAVVVGNGWSHAPWVPVEADETAADLVAAVDNFLDRTFGEREAR